MDTTLTGIFSNGDTKDLKEWIEKIAGASADRRSEIADLRAEIACVRQSVEAMQKKIDTIERLLLNLSE